MALTSFPLCWPVGWPRARSRTGAAFGVKTGAGYPSVRQLTIAEGAGRVMAELGRMGVHDFNVIISTNVKTGLNGMPVSNSPNPTDPGAAVYWEKKERRTVMAIDRYTRLADNLAAIAATLDAMRAIERHGGAQILERAFTGFTALPAPGQASQLTWREVLGYDIRTLAELELAYSRQRWKVNAPSVVARRARDGPRRRDPRHHPVVAPALTVQLAGFLVGAANAARQEEQRIVHDRIWHAFLQNVFIVQGLYQGHDESECDLTIGGEFLTCELQGHGGLQLSGERNTNTARGSG